MTCEVGSKGNQTIGGVAVMPEIRQMFLCIYKVRPEKVPEFKEHYQKYGVWDNFFCHAPGYNGCGVTELVDNLYLVCQSWSNDSARATYIKENGSKYTTIQEATRSCFSVVIFAKNIEVC